LVCKGFNADFDGDQMAVHLPLSIEAQVEATVLMMSTNNIFSPANGNPIITPSQDIVMGCYYLTASRGDENERVEAGDGMYFHSPAELFLAFAAKRVGTHAKVRVRLPADKKVIGETKRDGKTVVDFLERSPNGLVKTTVGRVIFNDILHPRMPYYDLPLTTKNLSRIIADCYLNLGRRETIELLDRMKDTGFRESTRSGLSFATDDLKTPTTKESVLKEKDREVEKYRKQYERGLLTDKERYNKVIDLWTDARDIIRDQLMTDLKGDRREGKPYLNPIYLMAISGARGGVEQIRQLAGMRGLMAKPSGQIIETPIKANFKEGLSVLEYFSSTHGARKGLADTALKTADSGYLTRKLADVAQNVVVTMEDCGTTQGISKTAIYKGEDIERSLSESIRGRVSRTNIMDKGQVLVRESEMITHEMARRIENQGIDKVMVRSPMTCQASLGVCRRCYGMDLATGALVEEGMAVGIIAAQSIGEPGTQLTMRTFHIGGVATRTTGGVENKISAKKAGTAKFERLKVVENDTGDQVVLSRNGEVVIVRNGEKQESYAIPYGSKLRVKDEQSISAGQEICNWDPHATPIYGEVGGTIKFEEIVEGETYRKERDAAGKDRYVIMEHRGELHPQIVIQDDRGQTLASYYIPEKAYLEVEEGERIAAGKLLAKTPREQSGIQDITGGLPRVTEIFEARRPRDPAVLAQVAGKIRLGERKRGKRIVWVQPEDDDGKPLGTEVEHQVPAGKQLRVHAGDYVKEGEALVIGPLVPHDILDIRGPEAVQEYLVREVQSVYRSQRVEIDDKHIEVIVGQMLRKVKIEQTGDTGLLPGSVMDKFAFRDVNERLVKECVKIKDPGDSRFEHGKIVSREAYEEEKQRLEDAGKKPPSWETPRPATHSVVLLGITKAAVQSDSFISAASFQETTKVLTEAAMAGKVDNLVGLKENVILGHLIPAGTGFRIYQDSEVRVQTDGEELPAEAQMGVAEVAS
jgi:DNA-directed RNA polymerase subunit beta'